MQNNKFINSILIALFALAIIFIFWLKISVDAVRIAIENTSKKELVGSSIDVRQYGSFATTTQATVPTSSVRLSATTTRAYAVYVNTGSNGVYLCMTADKVCTTATAGVYLAPGGGSYEMVAGENEYTASITAIASGGSSTINMGELK